MQKALFPMRDMNITQTYGVGTHRSSCAIDLAGKDSGIQDAYAPFDCVVKRTYSNGNTIWFESTSEVLRADGSKGYVTFYMTHDNNITNMRVGKKFKQGQVIYQEGTAGNASGNHIHFEASKSRFSGNGWYLNKAGYWGLNAGTQPEKIFFLKDTKVINGARLKWKKDEEEMTAQERRNMFVGITAQGIRKLKKPVNVEFIRDADMWDLPSVNMQDAKVIKRYKKGEKRTYQLWTEIDYKKKRYTYYAYSDDVVNGKFYGVNKLDLKEVK